MPKRVIIKNTKKSTHFKEISSHQMPAHPKQKRWQCGVCFSQYSIQEQYCAQCYQSLYYYYYVNGFMFVQKDQYLQNILDQNSNCLKNKKIQNRNFPKLKSQNVKQQIHNTDVNNYNSWIQNILLAD